MTITLAVVVSCAATPVAGRERRLSPTLVGVPVGRGTRIEYDTPQPPHLLPAGLTLAWTPAPTPNLEGVSGLHALRREFSGLGAAMAQLDEASIREEVQGREPDFEILEDWRTPSGNLRNAPMYEAEISNEYLRARKVVNGRTPAEVRDKAIRQLQQWENQEIRRRTAEAKDDLRAKAVQATEDAQAAIQEMREILHATLSRDDLLDWESMMDRTRFQPEPFREVQPPEPDYPTAPTSKRTLLQRLIPALERRREAAHQAACASHEAELSRLRGEWESAQQAWEKRRAEHARTQQEAKVQFEGAQQEKNDTIRSFRDRFEAGDADAIDEYARMVFERSVYPQSFSVSHECHFDPPSKTLLIDVSLPAPTDVPTTVGFKTADRNTRVVPIDMKAKEHDELYDGGVKQVVLRSMHEVFESIYTSYVEAVVVNGWTTITNRSTGHDEIMHSFRRDG